MGAVQAARMGDDVGAHASAFWGVLGFLGGLALGLAIGVLLVVATVATAGLLPALVGGLLIASAATGAIAMAAMGAGWLGRFGHSFDAPPLKGGSPCSKIKQGLVSVEIETMQAARQSDPVTHNVAQLRQGSKTVTMKHLPASRVDDKSSCSGKVIKAATFTFIGGEPADNGVSTASGDWFDRALHYADVTAEWFGYASMGFAVAAAIAGAAIAGLAAAAARGLGGAAVRGLSQTMMTRLVATGAGKAVLTRLSVAGAEKAALASGTALTAGQVAKASVGLGAGVVGMEKLGKVVEHGGEKLGNWIDGSPPENEAEGGDGSHLNLNMPDRGVQETGATDPETLARHRWRDFLARGSGLGMAVAAHKTGEYLAERSLHGKGGHAEGEGGHGKSGPTAEKTGPTVEPAKVGADLATPPKPPPPEAPLATTRPAQKALPPAPEMKLLAPPKDPCPTCTAAAEAKGTAEVAGTARTGEAGAKVEPNAEPTGKGAEHYEETVGGDKDAPAPKKTTTTTEPENTTAPKVEEPPAKPLVDEAPPKPKPEVDPNFRSPNHAAEVANTKSATQRMYDAGPNEWVATGNKSDGVLVQRGLTGDYSSGRSGIGEAVDVINGEHQGKQTVSLVGDEANGPKVTDETTSMYNDPLAVRGRVPAEALEAGRTDAEALTSRAIRPGEVQEVGSFSPTTEADAPLADWARSYTKLQDKLGITPEPGSRGAQFRAEYEKAQSVAKYGEHDGIGQPLLNRAEVDAAIADVARRYTKNGEMAPGKTPKGPARIEGDLGPGGKGKSGDSSTGGGVGAAAEVANKTKECPTCSSGADAPKASELAKEVKSAGETTGEGAGGAGAMSAAERTHIIEKISGKTGADILNHPLRQEYMGKVEGLAGKAEQLRAQGKSSQEVAHDLWQARRDIGVEYKHLTPEALRDYIYKVNEERYGDPLGPKFEDLFQKNLKQPMDSATGKPVPKGEAPKGEIYYRTADEAYDAIAKSSATPNKQVNNLLGDFPEWLKKQPDEYLKKVAGPDAEVAAVKPPPPEESPPVAPPPPKAEPAPVAKTAAEDGTTPKTAPKSGDGQLEVDAGESGKGKSNDAVGGGGGAAFEEPPHPPADNCPTCAKTKGEAGPAANPDPSPTGKGGKGGGAAATTTPGSPPELLVRTGKLVEPSIVRPPEGGIKADGTPLGGKPLLPPSTQESRPGQPVTLDPNKRYLWALPEDGTLRVAEQGAFTKVVDGQEVTVPRTGHPNLTGGGQAHMAGEINYDPATKTWVMDNDSGRYGFDRSRTQDNLTSSGEILTRNGVVDASTGKPANFQTNWIPPDDTPQHSPATR